MPGNCCGFYPSPRCARRRADSSDWRRRRVLAARLAPGGPWKDALRQAPAAIIITDKNVNRIRIGGVCSNAAACWC